MSPAPRPRRFPGLDDDAVDQAVARNVAAALAEDVGSGDASAALVVDGTRARARIISREAAVIAGIPWAEACFAAMPGATERSWHLADGDRIEADGVIVEIDGDAQAMLTAERSAMNFLQLLSGVATMTARFVDAVAQAGGTSQVLDTRKTIPGLRIAQKYAVRCGGGMNHRMGLFDAVLIKENHIRACGSIAAAVATARAKAPGLPVICEVETLDELAQAHTAGADRAMLDDFSLDQMRSAVEKLGGAMPLEGSGGVDLGTIGTMATTGVDFISVGALTKHIRAIDLSMRVTWSDAQTRA